jgi:GrpB-like predicted nucleotidyltransferase (UPF0157 family)
VDGSGRVVEVVPYDPNWPAQFELERQRLMCVLPGALSIEHIGSTSVVGLAAKPIIDIAAVVPEVCEIAADISGLARLGYVFRPLIFADDEDHLYFVKDTAGKRTHHLHVFGAVSPLPQENRIFRDYLAAQPDAARRYEAAKRKAAEAHPDSRARYADAKEAVMLELVEEARLWRGRGRGDGTQREAAAG